MEYIKKDFQNVLAYHQEVSVQKFHAESSLCAEVKHTFFRQALGTAKTRLEVEHKFRRKAQLEVLKLKEANQDVIQRTQVGLPG